MSKSHPSRPPLAFSPASKLATRLVFFATGFGMGTWAPIVPIVKERLGLGEGLLGALLLAVGLGSIFAMPIATIVAQRLGCRSVLPFTVALIAVTLPGFALAPNITTLVPVLVAFGAAVGSADCVVNMQAIQVEAASQRKLMSGFHGLFSLGALVGAAGVALLLSVGFGPAHALAAASALVLLLLAISYPGLLPKVAGATEQMQFALPGLAVLSFAILSFVAALLEGAMLDWSAVFLQFRHNIAIEASAIGYTVFALAMTTGRFTGDAVRARCSTQTVVIGGCLISAVGVTLVMASPWEFLTVAGFALVGIGLANLFPALVAEVGERPQEGGSSSVAAVLTAGYGGILAGPALIGFVAHLSNLVVAFLMLAVALLAAASVGWRALARQ
ncbi:MFS transporter [Ensifer sp. B1-9]|uniref:MFS transporter n=1 Tax=Ensifer sp. B1-9 TaxID=3141455 RepID=UPI003D1C07DB